LFTLTPGCNKVFMFSVHGTTYSKNLPRTNTPAYFAATPEVKKFYNITLVEHKETIYKL